MEQYASPRVVGEVLAAGGCDAFITTLDLSNQKSSLLLTDLADEVDLSAYTWMGTTSFARSRHEAVATARMLRDAFAIDVIKLDVRTQANTPDNEETALAAGQLVDEGFAVLPFVQPDVKAAARMAGLGCVAIRAQASPVASGRGIEDDITIGKMIEAVDIPVVIEGGLGWPSHAAAAMELGAAAILVNTAVAASADPARMAASMRHAVMAGRTAFETAHADEALAG